MVRYLLSKTERAYLEGTREFTKPQARCIRYRLNKKLKVNRDAAASVFRDAAKDKRGEWEFRPIFIFGYPETAKRRQKFEPTCPFGHGISNPTPYQARRPPQFDKVLVSCIRLSLRRLCSKLLGPLQFFLKQRCNFATLPFLLLEVEAFS